MITNAHALREKIGNMSGIRTRKRQAGGGDMVLLQARVSPHARTIVQNAAAQSGVSIAYYLEALVERLVQENGALPQIPRPRLQTETLDIDLEETSINAA